MSWIVLVYKLWKVVQHLITCWYCTVECHNLLVNFRAQKKVFIQLHVNCCIFLFNMCIVSHNSKRLVHVHVYCISCLYTVVRGVRRAVYMIIINMKLRLRITSACLEKSVIYLLTMIKEIVNSVIRKCLLYISSGTHVKCSYKITCNRLGVELSSSKYLVDNPIKSRLQTKTLCKKRIFGLMLVL
jgi:hypothetical protein